MTTGAVTGNNILELVFNATAWSNIAANATGSPATSLYAALHSADPTSSGTQSSNEIAYTGYSRVAVARSSAGWTVYGNAVSPVANITFPTGTGGAGTATYASIGMSSGGAGVILWSGPVSPSIIVGNDITPALTTASTVSIGPVTIPAPAVAAGYRTQTVNMATFSTANVDAGQTYASGFGLYLLNWFGFPPGTATFNGDGTVTLAANPAGEGPLTTMAALGSSPYFVGTAFGGGFYARARFKLNSTAVNIANGWPAWWGFSAEHVIAAAGGASDDWPGTSGTFTGSISGTALSVGTPPASGTIVVGAIITGSGVTSNTFIESGTSPNFVVNNSQSVGSRALAFGGFEHFGENDFFEYFGTGFGDNANDFASTLHDWSGGFNTSVSEGYANNIFSSQYSAPGQASFLAYHDYDCLYIPATASSPGSVSIYLDGVLQGSAVTWSQLTTQLPPSDFTGWPQLYGVLDQNGTGNPSHLALVIGGSSDAPLQLAALQVWQASAVNNLTN